MGKESMVRARLYCLCVLLIAASLMLPGCKKKSAASGSGAGAATVGQDQIDAVRDAMTRDMQEVSFTSLTRTHIGRKCVVTARTIEDTTKLGPPPPLGMVRLMGQTTIYRGEIDDVSPGGLTVRAAYPTPGNFKKLKIAKEDIQSIHVAK